MKVTLSFNGTKIVVPCGAGDISVRELTGLAVSRYKRAIGKHVAAGAVSAQDYWVSVHSLRSREGGMLDPDDRVGDVCDDREQLEAIFDEQDGANLGDGMASSDSEAERDNRDREANAVVERANAALGISQYPHHPHDMHQIQHHYQPHQYHQQQQQQQFHHHPHPNPLSHGYAPRPFTTAVPIPVGGEEEESAEQNFDSLSFDARCSLNVLRRREPLGASGNKPDRTKSEEQLAQQHQQQQQKQQEQEEVVGNGREEIMRPSVEVVIPNEIGPLGIHVVPCNDDGRLVVQGIEPGGRVDRDGRLAVGDEIVEINGFPLTNVLFNKAQEIFKEALLHKDLVLQVFKGVSDVVAEAGVDGGAPKEIGLGSSLDPAPPAAGSKVTAAVQANNTRKIGKVMSISLTKGPSGLGFSITTRDNATGGNTPIYIKNILPKGAAIEEGTLKPGDRLLEVGGVSVDGMSQSEVVALLRNAQPNSNLELVVSRHSVGGNDPETNTGTLPLKKPTLESKPQPPQEERDEPEPRSLSPEGVCEGDDEAATSTDNYESYDENNRGGGGERGGLPWKQREILTFDIPVHDSERAGLGVSVKGKTAAADNKSGGEGDSGPGSGSVTGGVVDLGIFVKSVIHGGAASRDGRLKTNDQLVNINGLSLLGKPNPQAMETLRKAMHEEGPLPGIISLTVARRKGAAAAATASDATESNEEQNVFRRGAESRDSMSSQVTSSSDDLFREYNVSMPKLAMSEDEVQQHPPPTTTQLHLQNSRNPVIDRLMGNRGGPNPTPGIVPSNIRNESYYMATNHDTWNAAQLKQHMLQSAASRKENAPPLPPPPPPLDCPTVHQRAGEALMIEQGSTSTLDGAGGGGNSNNVTRESLTSLVDNSFKFARDQPGRQSMSEKRHATLDAKSTDTYQKRKKNREEMLKQRHLELQQGNKVTWKSASVESLHTAGAGTEFVLSEEEREALKNSCAGANSVRVSRSRGCNESFRQAVDRSYEGEGSGTPGEDYEIEDDEDEDGGGSGSAAKRYVPNKKSSNKLLRNFGAMFRLGSGGAGSKKSEQHHHRKSLHGTSSSSSGGAATAHAPSTSSLPQSQSVPDYRALYAKSRSGGDLAHSAAASDFARPLPPHQQLLQQQQQQQQHLSHHHPHHAQPHLQHGQPHSHEVYEYLPSAMVRPGSRVGIADPGQHAGSSDYEVIQRHLMHRSRNSAYDQHQPQQQQQVVHRRPHQQQSVHSRSHSNPARARPKSNFYEYDTWMSGDQFGLPQTQPAMARRPVPPQKPNERSIQQHFSSLASTDPYLYSAAGSMPPPPLPPPVHAPQPQNTQQHLYQQQQRQYMYAAADPNLAMVHQRPNAHAHHATNLPKMS